MIWDLWVGLTVFTWVMLLRGVWRWGEGFELPIVPTTARETVRVCVPARDEVDNIGVCVTAILASEGIELELVVVDDESTDGTSVVAAAAGADDPRFRLFEAPVRPPGKWAGKPWACHAASAGATTDWLLFVDADVRVSPHAIATAVERGRANSADLLSLFGTWQLETFWERVAVPAIGWFIRGFASPSDVNAGRRAFANGQFLLVRRSAYLEVGGHEAVAGEVLDDVRLAEACRAAGQRLWLLWSPDAFRVRLYDGLSAIFDGYRKNVFEGAGRVALLPLLGAAFTVATTVLPPLAAPIFWAVGMPMRAGWMAVITAMVVVWRFAIEQRDGRSGVMAPLHFLGAAVLAAVLVASVVAGPVSWKGRTFPARP